jgi:hypothetical protein
MTAGNSTPDDRENVSDGIESVEGIHAPESTFGEATVDVQHRYWSKSEGHTVGLLLKFPNGTNSSVRLDADAARALADNLVRVAAEVEEADE